MTTETGVHEKGTFSFLNTIDKMRSRKDFRKVGAIATFIGVVRGETAKGESVQKLMMEAYEEKANEVLAKICDDLRKKQGIIDVQIHHLLGEFSVGDDLIYALVAGSHREIVFSVLKEAVDRYKREVPIFKKEYVKSGKGEPRAYWVTEHKSSL